ncbi:GNAT family N-acetyltransferase [Kitasatospora sp. NBC_01266]|uniref:GNAT family N-acetyltransferase n=1 Tax=Kitasatospora sp. NBC_01266 TaxID=2903572 RepID=UPI002E32F4E2|nr:GNAT family N-acetyltransferase [Kitasatospora sp. NBC_01266]
MTHIRLMLETDIATVSEIRVAGWQSAYEGIIPKTYLDGMSTEQDARSRLEAFRSPGRRAIDLVAVDATDTPLGWLCFGPYKGDVDVPEAAGEIYALYVRPDLIGTGIGRSLLQEAHRRAAQQYRVMLLWVVRDNRRARDFYAAAAYFHDGATASEDYQNQSVIDVRYRRQL